MILMAENVNLVLTKCLSYATDHNIDPDVLLVSGCMENFALSKDQLSENRDNILTMLSQLPIPFRAVSIGGDGGTSLLNGPMTIDGRQWGEQIDADHLFVLGMAIGVVSNVFRRLQVSLPGGLPFYVIHEVKEVTE